MDHLDNSNIYESIREELLSFHKNREIGVVERILFTDSIYNTWMISNKKVKLSL